MKKNSNKKPFMSTLKISMIVLTLIYPVFMDILSGLGIIYNSESYGSQLTMIGVFLIVGSVLMIIGVILCLFGVNILSIIISTIGFIICMAMLYMIINHADSSGWHDKYNSFKPVSDMYMIRILPTIAPFILNISVALLQFFSYEYTIKRKNTSTLSVVDVD